MSSGHQGQPAVAGFRGTQFVVVCGKIAAAAISRGQMLGVNGAKTGSEFLVNFPGEPGTQRQLPAVVECGLGFAVAWTEQAPGAQPQLKLRTFDQDTLSGPESQVSTAEVEPSIRPAMGRTTARAAAIPRGARCEDVRWRYLLTVFDERICGSLLTYVLPRENFGHRFPRCCQPKTSSSVLLR
jgi:hypothetical protein